MSKKQSNSNLTQLIAKAISAHYAISEKDIVSAYDKLQSWDQLIMTIGLCRLTGHSPEVLLQMAVEVKGLEKIN